MWEINARLVEDLYGGFVDWEERFYNCPECGEPIYECDWEEGDLDAWVCPVCEFNCEDEEEYFEPGRPVINMFELNP